MAKNEPVTSVFPFSEESANLELVGGKGANLVRLVQAGFPVPDGFLISTHAYSSFVELNGIDSQIRQIVMHLDAASPDTLADASSAIKRLFEAGEIPQKIADEILRAYRLSGEGSVAVRSSATAEDLPDLSFAGQQDTYLNINGEKALLDAVIHCWASLWTARAIGYRVRNGIAHENVQLGVVVQKMVNSQASGVLFTANPLTGMRGHTVIDATLGLGEALVSGLVEPDHYLVDSSANNILMKTLGRKAVVTRFRAEGGVETVEQQGAELQAVTDDQICSLTVLGGKVAAHFGSPQDIEWAISDGKVYLLQSRPITSLYPIPPGLAEDPLHVMLSVGAVQGLLDPVTCLGQDSMRYVMSGGARLMNYHTSPQEQGVFRAAGERLWIDITGMFQTRIGRKLMDKLLVFIEPGSFQVIKELLDDRRLKSQIRPFRISTFFHILSFFLPQGMRVISLLVAPVSGRNRLQRRAEKKYLAFGKQVQGIQGDRNTRFSLRIASFKHLMEAFPRVMPTYAAGLMAGMVSFNILTQFEKHGQGLSEPPENLVLQSTRGLPNNVTTEMDLALWNVAVQIRRLGDEAKSFVAEKPENLTAAFLSGKLPAETQKAVEEFLDQYGMRGLGEIDIGRSRWRENPTPVMQSLQSYLRIENEKMGPDVVFKNGEQQADAAIDRLCKKLAHRPGGAVKAFIARLAYKRMRALMGLRESPKFYIIRMMGVIREALLASGADFAQDGVIERAEDLFFLKVAELERLASDDHQDWRGLIADRRSIYVREKRRFQIPRVLLSSGEAFYSGVEEKGLPLSDDNLIGSPVSPGVVEGFVRIVLDPNGTQLLPGEILVCPGTDPSWTPLFLAAGGLVMEVGGMMTHGSVVAREYGIPAVVGVCDVTRRLRTGQFVRVNGSTGCVELLKD